MIKRINNRISMIHEKATYLANGCIETTFGLTGNSGYPKLTVNGKTLTVAKYLLGFIHPIQYYVLHTCDNRKCININHLYDGTPKENMRDMSVRGRSMKRTHCIHGHELIPQNVYKCKENKRHCIICRKDATRRSQNARKYPINS